VHRQSVRWCHSLRFESIHTREGLHLRSVLIRSECRRFGLPKRGRAPFVALADLLVVRRPDVESSAIADGRVLVDGRVLTNPAARVRYDASIRVMPERRLRGEIKLTYALHRFRVDVDGCVTVDVGANVGGFTTALLNRGARRIYAVDAGVGQLLGRLRSNPRVINLEGCNLGELSVALVPESVDVIAVDVSYVSLADAAPQLNRLDIRATAELVALVKPTFELHRGSVAASPTDVATAVDLAADAIDRAGWHVVDVCDAPATGQRGAREAFIHARRAGPRPRLSSPGGLKRPPFWYRMH
jgi:23S rRNA (cytidine1920-2'-O)/16S rRNA (cytidine1409-2'-O)-methyltransferase